MTQTMHLDCKIVEINAFLLHLYRYKPYFGVLVIKIVLSEKATCFVVSNDEVQML